MGLDTFCEVCAITSEFQITKICSLKLRDIQGTRLLCVMIFIWFSSDNNIVIFWDLFGVIFIMVINSYNKICDYHNVIDSYAWNYICKAFEFSLK